MNTLFFLSIILVSLTSALPFNLFRRQVVPQSWIDYLLFDTSLDHFLQLRETQAGPNGTDWSSDGCTFAADYPGGWNFRDSCVRHDFGYRNYKKFQYWNKPSKQKIDMNFLNDLLAVCKKVEWKTVCTLTAEFYYEAVNTLGGMVSKKRRAELLAQIELLAHSEGLKGALLVEALKQERGNAEADVE